ncbi:MAG: motility protein A [Clostridium sp.]|nr:motility protein A [Clostridium sp.]
MDIATLIGIVIGVACILVTIILEGNVLVYWSLTSLFVTVGGGIASVLVAYRIGEIAKVMKVVVKVFKGKELQPQDTIRLLVDLSLKARKEGLLSLESDQEDIEDSFLKQSLQLVVDGVEPEVIVESMDLEIENMQMRHSKGSGIFKTLASLFPAWGMIGTLIGLINLLQSLDDPSAIGPAMALALITTFYGSVLANFICTPIATKLELQSKEEIQEKRMIIEGILSIQSGENPRILEHKLRTFLSPQQKEQYDRDSEQSESKGSQVRDAVTE